MSCGEEIDKWKVDLVGKFFGVDAGHEGIGDDEGGVGGVGEEKIADHNTLGRVDKEFNKLPNAGMKEETVMETVLATSLLGSCVTKEEESVNLEQSGGLSKEEVVVKESTVVEDSNNNKCIKNFLVPKYQFLCLNINSELPAKKGDLTEPMYRCQQCYIRLPGCSPQAWVCNACEGEEAKDCC